MKDVVTFLDKTLVRAHETLAGLADSFKEFSEGIEELNGTLRSAQIDARVVSSAVNDGKYRTFFENRIVTLNEYVSRCSGLEAQFSHAHPKINKFIKQLRVQVTMLQTQIRYQYDTFDDQEIVDTITGNIQTISDLITVVNEKIGKFQIDAQTLRDVLSKQRALHAELKNYVESMRS